MKIEDTHLTHKWMLKQHNKWWQHELIHIKKRFSVWDRKNGCDDLVRRVSTERIEGSETWAGRHWDRLTPSGSCLACDDFPTGVILLPLEESLGRQPGVVFIFDSAATPKPTVRELPGSGTHLRHKGQCSTERNKTPEKEGRAGQADKAGTRPNRASNG